MNRFLAVLLCTLIFARTGNSISIHWQQGPDMPSPRDRLGSGVVWNLFVVAGGAYWKHEQKYYHSETIAYSPKTKRWVRLPHLLRPGAYGASAVLRDEHGNEQLLIAGGINETGATTECFRLVRQGSRLMWKRLPPLPRPLVGAAGAVIGRSFYVFGGAEDLSETGLRTAYPCMFVLEFDNHLEPIRGWRQVDAEPRARIGAAFVACGKRLFVFGGYGPQEDETIGNFGDAWVMEVSRIPKWKRIHNMPIPARWVTAITLDDTHIALLGGFGDKFLNEIFIYDTEKDEYLHAGTMPKACAAMASGQTKDGTIYLAGGEDEMRHRSSSLFIGRITHN